MDQDPTVEGLLQRVQQLEVRYEIHDRGEGREKRTPLSREIELEPLPCRFTTPNIPQYNEDGDPYDHLDAFNVLMELQTSSSLVKCRVFPATLGNIPRTWLRSLRPRNICSWEECQRKFIGQYRSLRWQLASTCHLATMFQQPNESLKDYIERFKHEVNTVDDPSDESTLTAISARLRKDRKLYESIYKSPIRDLDEFYERAANEDMIFSTKKGDEDFGRPNPIRTPNKFRNKDKSCAYHDEVGHNTSECQALKDAIEDLIRRGRFHDYVV
ncbi:uncharacterized protein LOC127799790 [Diospyros lotus]|uniref:uncharacterized protein LOC127799790 n=1 Tax=Diospyros lotus TaxID=55363 RepID=UPI002254621D|nr:uncharacterized protein LOC127799790 [Diospyros lotus]